MGVALVLLGVLLSEWVFAALFVPDGKLDSGLLRLLSWSAAGVCVAAGVWLLVRPPRERTPATRPRYRFALAAGATVAALLVAEGVLRLAGFTPWTAELPRPRIEPGGSMFVPHPAIGYTLRPGRYRLTLPTGLVFSAHHRPGAGGRATGVPAADMNAAGPAVWLFGCSWAYGWSLDDEETLAWQLRRHLPQARIANHGVPGYSTVQSLRLFEALVAEAPPPALVVLAYASFHNARNTSARTRRKQLSHGPAFATARLPRARFDADGEVVYTDALLGYQAPPLITHSALVNLVDDAANALEQQWLDAHGVSEQVVLDFAEAAQRQGARFVVATLTGDPTSAALRAFCARHGIAAVDISVDILQPGFSNAPFDDHPSAAAHAIYAERLATFLKAYLPEADPPAPLHPTPAAP